MASFQRIVALEYISVPVGRYTQVTHGTIHLRRFWKSMAWQLCMSKLDEPDLECDNSCPFMIDIQVIATFGEWGTDA
jgi:hypothetical protein